MNYSIHEIAHMFGNTVGAIRFYEEKGLIRPERDAAGNRVYTPENIMELFYLRKYCTFGLKIKEVADYFERQNTKSMADVSALLEEKRLEAIQQSLYYEKSAQWIAAYNDRLQELDSYIDTFTPIHAPDYYALMGEALVGKTKEDRSIAQKWIAAAPMSRVSGFTDLSEGDEPAPRRSAFIISKDDAHALNLPLPHYARLMKSAPCMYTVVRIQAGGFDMVTREQLLAMKARLEAAGHTVCGLAISNVFFVHTIGGEQYKYFEVFIPVDADYPILQEIP